jgi:hypothetical protein
MMEASTSKLKIVLYPLTNSLDLNQIIYALHSCFRHESQHNNNISRQLAILTFKGQKGRIFHMTCVYIHTSLLHSMDP